MTTFYDKTGLPKSLAWGFIGVLIFMIVPFNIVAYQSVQSIKSVLAHIFLMSPDTVQSL